MSDHPQGSWDHCRVLALPVCWGSTSECADRHLPAEVLDYCRGLCAMLAASVFDDYCLRLRQRVGSRQIMGTKQLLRPLQKGVLEWRVLAMDFLCAVPRVQPFSSQARNIWKIIILWFTQCNHLSIPLLHPDSPSVKSALQSRTLPWANP